MGNIKLMPHQVQALERTEGKQNVAYYYDMGLGKTFIGSEKMRMYGKKINLVICQKSKINDWVEHFDDNYPANIITMNLTNKKEYLDFIETIERGTQFCLIGIINYELAYRRKELQGLNHYTLMLDESSMIKNETAKRTKFILSLKPEHVILLSGTPTDGKYEYLYSQLKLLGMQGTKKKYYDVFIKTQLVSFGGPKIPIVTGYKNIPMLKQVLNKYGAVFAKTSDVMTLPDRVVIKEYADNVKQYKDFIKKRVVKVGERELVGDTSLTLRMYSRMLCGVYNDNKINAFKDIIDGTSDRVIVFYNFNVELDALINSVKSRPISIVNGTTKDLTKYDEKDNSITFVQYQAGAMGLNLQKANRIIYFSLPERSELFEQSKARISRIGQKRTCFYHIMMCKGSVEEKIFDCLQMRKDYTDELFRKDFNVNG